MTDSQRKHLESLSVSEMEQWRKERFDMFASSSIKIGEINHRVQLGLLGNDYAVNHRGFTTIFEDCQQAIDFYKSKFE